MTEIMQKFLELDNWLNENYKNISLNEYEEKVKELNELCSIITNE